MVLAGHRGCYRRLTGSYETESLAQRMELEVSTRLPQINRIVHDYPPAERGPTQNISDNTGLTVNHRGAYLFFKRDLGDRLARIMKFQKFQFVLNVQIDVVS